MSKKKNTKFIFVTGGVTSSLGKGIISASLGVLLKERGFKVTIQKLDPYINVDPGTMNPYEHGECYVTEDGAETDLDLGHYERFLNSYTSQKNNITAGKIYKSVIEKERKGKYLGKTVQVIPHITDEIKKQIKSLSKDNFDFIITEIGGTVGDIESLPFIEAIRQLKWELESNALVMHLTLIPYLHSSGELKTKPTQNSVKKLRELGLQPDIIVCRTRYDLTEEVKNKVALFCNIDKPSVIESKDAETIYEVPCLMKKEKLDKVVLKKLKIQTRKESNLTNWNKFLKNFKNPKKETTIALVGKYIELKDSYKSIVESLYHAGAKNKCKVNIKWFHSEDLTKKHKIEELKNTNGVLVAPGFGDRGIEGKIQAIKYVRENKIPFFGICLGMQCAVIEFGRNVLKLKKANSTEFDNNTKYPVIDLMENQKKISYKGGTMRLGSYECEIKKNSKAFNIYNENKITERHRHRYEFNNHFLSDFEKNHFIASGINKKLGLVEIVEYKNHPWFIGVQFHPEFKSTVEKAQPLFVSFIKQSLKTNG